MNLGIADSLQLLFSTAGSLFTSGAWIIFIPLFIYVAWDRWMNFVQGRYLKSVNFIMISVDVPKENEQSLIAVEQIFAHMHSFLVNRTFGEKFFYGMFQLWITFEIVSFGGQVKYLVHMPDKARNLVESAIYACYPDAEIREVDDYMKNVPNYNPQNSHYDLWGTEMQLKKEDSYPIRTYRAFEHTAAKVIVDPLAAVLESLSSIAPHELMAVQYQLRPVDDKWKEKGKRLIKKLKGDPEEQKAPNAFVDIFGRAFGGLLDMFGLGGSPPVQEQRQQQPILPLTKMAFLTPGERTTIESIEMNLSKIGYATKIRLLYLAPKEKFRGEMKQGIVGSFRQFDDINLNGLKPLMKIWTGRPFKFSKTLETPYINYIVNRRKKRFINFFKGRLFVKGAKPFILNIEELATILHFPLINVKAPQMVKAEIRKAEAPINLPTE